MVQNYALELNQFVIEHNIKLNGNYDMVKKTTMIHFNCKTCNNPIKKSYKYLTSTNSCLVGMCHRCVRQMCY